MFALAEDCWTRISKASNIWTRQCRIDWVAVIELASALRLQYFERRGARFGNLCFCCIASIVRILATGPMSVLGGHRGAILQFGRTSPSGNDACGELNVDCFPWRMFRFSLLLTRLSTAS